MLRDHVFSNVYVCQYDEENTKFNFDNDEINGLVKVNAKECLQLLNKDIVISEEFLL